MHPQIFLDPDPAFGKAQNGIQIFYSTVLDSTKHFLFTSSTLKHDFGIRIRTFSSDSVPAFGKARNGIKFTEGSGYPYSKVVVQTGVANKLSMIVHS